MEQFIQQAVSQLGISDDQARSATGGVLGMLKDNLEGDTFSDLLGKLPGAESLVDSADSGGGGGGGLLGGALGGLGSALGGQLGGAASLLSLIQGSGLSGDQAGSFVSMLMNYVKSEAGTELLDKVLKGVPQLKSLLG